MFYWIILCYAQYRLLLKFVALTGLRIGDVLDDITSGKYRLYKYKEHYYIKNFTTHKYQVEIKYLFLPTELTTMIQSIYPQDLKNLDLTKLFLTRNNTRIKEKDFLERLKKISEEIGIDGNAKIHDLRKYFRGQIGKCKAVTKEFKEHLTGHKIKLSQYLNKLKDINYFYSQWLKIEELICIDCEII
ncbi:MAG: tyrosine-type recombinase/integrase, partial [Candidatus Lokiarchaeota archaeon]|nr:tyrosine-type recombinase/integrase [Candidatus Lokiarchaeota archaeon]